jgi:hypothetical protein
MPDKSNPPSFDQFSRWLAARLDQPALRPERYPAVKEAAHAARDEFVRARAGTASVEASAHGPLEVLYLMAAADKSEAAQLPEIVTSRGFRVLLALDQAGGSEASSMGVLVHCPAELISALEGKTVYLWYDGERVELGQFDGEGKAIGALPDGVEITASDFAQGKVKLEEPLVVR